MTSFKETVGSVVRELGECLGKVSATSVQGAIDDISGARRIFCAGAGRSRLAVSAFTMRLMHLGKAAHLVGEVATPGISAGDLLIIGSGSGRTESLLAMANKAKKLGARILLLTIDPASPIGQLADRVIEIPAPSPKASTAGGVRSIQPMGSLFEQSLFLVLDTLVILLMNKEGVTAERMFGRHANLE